MIIEPFPSELDRESSSFRIDRVRSSLRSFSDAQPDRVAVAIEQPGFLVAKEEPGRLDRAGSPSRISRITRAAWLAVIVTAASSATKSCPSPAKGFIAPAA